MTKLRVLSIVAIATFVPLTATSAYSEMVLEEVVVQAQKRSQSSQDVGIAITAITGDQLRDQGLKDLSELPKSIANVDLSDAYGGGILPVWEIRGVGLRDFNANNTPAAAVYVDEVYQTSSAQGAKSLFDVERIEVLKGPQGGLYGRNTSAGAVLVSSVKPQLDELNGSFHSSLSRWNRRELEAAINVPLYDKAALRLSIQRIRSDDKWQKNIVTGEGHGEEDVSNARLQLLFTPIDELDVLLKLERNRNKSETTQSRALPTFTSAGRFAGYCSAFVAGESDLNSCFFADGAPASVLGDNPNHVYGDLFGRVNNTAEDAVLKADWDLGLVTITSVSSYTDFEYNIKHDWTGVPGDWVKYDSQNSIQSWGQEFRVAGDYDESITWLAGVMYAEDEYIESRDTIVTDSLGPLGLPPVGELDYQQKTESWASYGQLEYRFNDEWNAILSLRYTDEEKKLVNNSFTASVIFGFPTGLITPVYELEMLSGKFSLEWTPTDDSLIYASVSKGFKAGGYFGGFPTSPAAISQYDEETNYAYELGVKSEWLDRSLRFNSAIFYYDYRNGQDTGSANVDIVSGAAISALTLTNVGDYEYRGAEAELDWLPLEGLSFRLGIGYLDGDISKSNAVGYDEINRTYFPLQGKAIASVPRWTYNLVARYERELSQNLQLSFQLDHNFTDEKTADLNGGSVGSQRFNTLGESKTSNLRVGLREQEGWSAALFVKNISNNRFRTVRGYDAVVGFAEAWNQPRSWGVEIGYEW